MISLYNPIVVVTFTDLMGLNDPISDFTCLLYRTMALWLNNVMDCRMFLKDLAMD